MDRINLLQPRREVFDHTNKRFLFLSRLQKAGDQQLSPLCALSVPVLPRIFHAFLACVTTQTPQGSGSHQEPNTGLSQRYCTRGDVHDQPTGNDRGNSPVDGFYFTHRSRC